MRPRACLLLLLVAALAAPLPGAAAALRVQRITYRGWPGSYRMTNGTVAIVVVPAIGGRIMEYSLKGRNLLWENPAEFGKVYDAKPDPWRNYGGYKTWNAPQDRWGFPPDVALDRGPATVRVLRARSGAPVGLEIVGQESPRFRLRFTKRVLLDPRTGVLRLEQRMRNTASRPQTWSVWDVTQVPVPCRVVFRTNPKSRFPGGLYYYDEKARRTGQAAVRGGLATVTWKGVSAKFGGDCVAGWMVRLDGPIAYIKRFPPMKPGAPYPDQGAYAQVYTNGRELPYVEMEIAGPLVNLRPGQETSLSEEWELVPLSRLNLSAPAAIRELQRKGKLRPLRPA